jgi:hypothetical protein
MKNRYLEYVLSLKIKNDIEITEDQLHIYVKLLCRYNGAKVLPFLLYVL